MSFDYLIPNSRYNNETYKRFYEIVQDIISPSTKMYALPYTLTVKELTESHIVLAHYNRKKKKMEVRSLVFFVIGMRGSGKSSFLEYLGEHYLRLGSGVVDMFGSRDGEGLAWLRSPWAKALKVLLIHSPNVEVETPIGDTLPYTEFNKELVETYDIIISAAPLYVKMDEEYVAVNKMIEELFNRFTWKRHIYIIVREASRLFYSRLKVSENQYTAKAQTANIIREFRHLGMSMGLDTQHFTGVDKQVRDLADYIIIKNMGQQLLPKELRFVYAYVPPDVVHSLEPHEFVAVAESGTIWIGVFKYPPWHKEPDENIIAETKIVVHKKEGKTTKTETVEVEPKKKRRRRKKKQEETKE